MAKRKRSQSPSNAPALPTTAAPQNLAHQKKQCLALLDTAAKSLLTILRHGASLERQKHSRRKKTATQKRDTKALARLDAEYAVLKILDLAKVADQHLRRTVGKVKSLKECEAMREYVAGVEKSEQEAVRLNVLARLYKTKGFKECLDGVVAGLKGIVGVGGGVPVQAQAQEKSVMKVEKVEKRKKARVEENEERDVDMGGLSDDEGDAFAVFSARIAAPSSGEESDGSVSDDERPPSIGNSDSEHDPEDDLDAGSDSDDADTEEDVEDDDEDVVIDRRIAPPSDVESDSSATEAVKPAKLKTKTKKEAKPTSSAFLPSLAHAAYYSDPDSSASDLDTAAPRKNRRGQRARQKIAEAKFGAKAKHLEKVERNKGWDAKRGAVSDDRRGGRGDRGPRAGGRAPQISGENAMPLGGSTKEKEKERDDKGTLHPSWQAAKAAKEKKMIKIDLKGQGGRNKVIFD